MRIIVCLFLFILKTHLCGANNYVNKCIFTVDGKFALVSEFDNINLNDLTYKIPVWGLYKLGTNAEAIKYVGISNDSVYYLTLTNGVEFIQYHTIDSIRTKNNFLKEYKLYNEGVDITKEVKLLIKSKKRPSVRNSSIVIYRNWTEERTRGRTKMYNHIITYEISGKEFYRDTIKNTYGKKKFLKEGLCDFEKKDIINKDGTYRMTVGYPIKIYTDKNHNCFFIRANYRLKSYAKVTYLHSAYLGQNAKMIKEKRMSYNGIEIINKDIRTLIRVN